MGFWDKFPEILSGGAELLHGVANTISSAKGNGSTSGGGSSQQQVVLPEKKQNNTTLWLVGIGGVLLIGTLLVVFLKTKKT